jgi:hypothetical protein
MSPMATASKQLESNNLKVIKDQIIYESLMNKKFHQFAQCATEPEVKNICNEACAVHKQNFNNLKSYLDSHQ